MGRTHSGCMMPRGGAGSGRVANQRSRKPGKFLEDQTAYSQALQLAWEPGTLPGLPFFSQAPVYLAVSVFTNCSKDASY